MNKPDFQKFIQHHVDTKQIGILTNPIPAGLGEIAVYSFNSHAVTGHNDVIMSYDPNAGPQAAALIINTVTDWLKAQTELPDSHILGTVAIEGMEVNGGPLRVQLIATDGNDTQQFMHEWSKYQRGPDYMDKMAVFPRVILIQPADPSNLLPGEPGFDTAFIDRNFVYYDSMTNRPYKQDLADLYEGATSLNAFSDETLRPTIHGEYAEMLVKAEALAKAYPVNAWIPPHLSLLTELTRNQDSIDFATLRVLNDRFLEMIDRLD